VLVEQDGAMLRYKYARIIQGFGIWIKQGGGALFWMGFAAMGGVWNSW